MAAAVEPNDITARMRATLALVEPDLDTTVGTVTRKILDTVAETIAEGFADRYLLSYAYDIDAKSGGDLDDFVALFGFTRLVAKRAVGAVTFERTSVAQGDVIIPMFTQLATDDATPVLVQTIVPAVMVRTDLSLTVPAQAVDGGTRGNIAAGALTRAISPLDGVGTYTNQVAFTGGTEAESDEALRTRFKRTVFRSMAGTEQQFVGTALEDPAVSLVNVLGASKRHREQIEIIGGTATSVFTDVRYTYPDSAVLGVDIDAGDIAIPNVHYTFNPTTRSVTVIGGALPNGIYDLEYEYVPFVSRNDPPGGITNRVDVYVNGTRVQQATEMAIFRSARVFVSSPTSSPMWVGNFVRPNGTLPTAGNYLIDYSFAPVLDAAVMSETGDEVGSTDDTVVINGITYTEGTHFWTVNDISREGGTGKSLSGMEFRSAANGNALAIPANGQTFAVSYIYNAVPGDVEEAIRAWRLITTDVRVHAAQQVRLRLHLVVILDPGTVLASVQTAIGAAISEHLLRVGFAGVVQISDLIEVVAGVAGVDAVRFKTSADDATNYAIQRVSETGTVLSTYSSTDTPRRAVDIILGDESVPVFDSVVISVKAQNSFGVV